MRYSVINDTVHRCCLRACVVDLNTYDNSLGWPVDDIRSYRSLICECECVDTAKKIADALNKTDRH